MNFLFIHQNFPGQFKFFVPELIRRGHKIVAMRMSNKPIDIELLSEIKLETYFIAQGSTPTIHPWVTDFESKMIRAEGCFRHALKMRDLGYTPDVIIAHHGWGESMFLKEVWPHAKLGIYCEFFYQPKGLDTGFDPEFPSKDPGNVCRLRLKNLNNLMHFQVADAGISPTKWQASTFPESFRSKISVIHDGIDTKVLSPSSDAQITLNGQLVLTKKDEVITFVNRNLEPYRGYHIFMRALPEILKKRPNARVLIVGGDDVSYGSRPENGRKWKDIFLDEIRTQLTENEYQRIYFLGSIPYKYFVLLLKISTVHVYLTYPFVLSWSLLEAMSVGCAIVASDTPPVREVINHNETGILVDFFDFQALAKEVCALADDFTKRKCFGEAARIFVQKNYDLKNVCLPMQLEWVEKLAYKE